MTCQEFRDHYASPEVDGSFQEALKHLSECAGCEAWVDEEARAEFPDDDNPQERPMAKKTEAAKPRQPRLHPALEPDRIPAIDAASRDYVKVRDAHAAQTKLLAEKKDDLMKLMRKHRDKIGSFDGAVKYETGDDMVVVLSEKEDIKVKRRGAENEETS